MVGDSVICHAEMSADIASIPSWKIALLERKRLQDKESSGSNVIHTPSGAPSHDDQEDVVGSHVPAWKRDILTRKQNQKNSSVFLAKHGQTDNSQSNDTVSSISNGHVHSLVYDPELDAAVVDIDINDTTEDEPLEERLLPIHQNPILRLDLKKRYKSSSSSGSTRSSLSPKVTSTSSGSQVHSSDPSSVSTQAPVTPDAVDAVNEEVFSNDNDYETEVAYGRGFVHKLLMKFSHLSSSSNEHTPNNRYSKQRFSSLGDHCKKSSTGLQRKSSRDLESISSKRLSMPTTRFHSVDDLLNETKFAVQIDQGDSADELDITVTNDVNGEVTTHLDHGDVDRNEDDVTSKRDSNCEEIADELPFANIVSSARSLFESLAVHSASQKQSTSLSSIQNTASSRFSYIGTLERSHHSKNTPTTKTEVSTPKKFDHSYSSLNKSVKSTAEEPHSNGTSSVTDDGESQRNADARIESDANKSVQESVNKMSSCTVVNSPTGLSSTSTDSDSSMFNRNVNISATKLSQPASTCADLTTGNSDVPVVNSPVKDQEREIIPVAFTTQVKSAVDESHSFTDGAKSSAIENTSTSIAKPIHVDNSSLFSQPADKKENVKSQPAFSGKKPAPSRPGKLVIRPASNLVAAKTSSEYLELTKFNDVRKGEFAPPLKKERIDPAFDDDTDKADGVASDSVTAEEYVFDGAGVIIGQSLLTKTNKRKSVNTENLSIIYFSFFFLGYFSCSESAVGDNIIMPLQWKNSLSIECLLTCARNGLLRCIASVL